MASKTRRKAVRIAPARAGPTFDGQSFLASIELGRTTAKYPRDAPVYIQGSPADAVYYIERGKIQIRIVSKQGREAIIANLLPGEFFGEGCLAGQMQNMASAFATADATIVRVDKAAMVRAL